MTAKPCTNKYRKKIRERESRERAGGGGCAHPRERANPPPPRSNVATRSGTKGDEGGHQLEARSGNKKKRATRGAINSGGGSGGAKKNVPPTSLSWPGRPTPGEESVMWGGTPPSRGRFGALGAAASLPGG